MKNGCAQLYAFIAFYHLFLGANVNAESGLLE
jgi:hypothetical protein